MTLGIHFSCQFPKTSCTLLSSSPFILSHIYERQTLLFLMPLKRTQSISFIILLVIPSSGQRDFWRKVNQREDLQTYKGIDQLSLPIQSNLSLEPRPSACPLLVPLPLLDDRFKAPKSESIHSSRCWIDCGDKVDHSIIASSNSWIKISD
jgi:hypothetical protein